jgi:transposase-like protein
VPPRIPDDKRAAILTAIRAGSQSRAQIARDHGVSPQTVGNIARDSGDTDAFSRLQTEKATHAAVADNRSRRARIASDLLDDVMRLRERAWSEYTYYERGQMGPELVTLKQPPLKEAKEAYVAIGICLQRHAELEKLDAARGDEGARSMLGDLADALEQAARGPGQ